MAIPKSLQDNENNKFVESSSVAGKPAVAVTNPDGTNIGGGSGGASTIADGADVAEGVTTDASVAAGAAGTVSAKLRRLTTDLDAQNTLIGVVTETAPVTDTASSGLNGRLQRIAQRLTSLIALIPTALGAGGGLKVDGSGTALPVSGTITGITNQVDTNLKQIGGTNTVNGGTAGSQSVGGMVANNGTINSAVNPILVGGQAVSSENAANTTAKLSQFITDLVGKLIVLPYANPENFVSGAITTAMTGTTTTSLIAAPAAGLRNYITQITVSNAHATVGTDVIIQDGSGGTTLYTIPAAAVYGGAAITLPTPLRQPTTATAIFCANVTTGASTKVSASGYKGA